jgi:hypothetical protein
VNSGSANGSQPFEQASSYLYLNGGQSTFTFTLGSYTSNAYPTTSLNLITGHYYTAIAYGRADVGATDLRYPGLIVLADNSAAIPSGTSLVRFVNAAPDGGSSTFSQNSTQLSNQQAYGTASAYFSVPSGSFNFIANNSAASPISKTFSISSGSAYTIVLDENTIPSGTTAAAYDMVLLQDN